MENRYPPVRLVWYTVRKGNKKSLWNSLELKKLYLYRPSIAVVNGCLVINNFLNKWDKDNWPHWDKIMKAFREEAEELYPEFKGRIKILDDEKEI